MRAFFLEHWRAYAVIIAYVFCAHFLMIVNDLPYWDSWTYHIRIQNGDYNGFMVPWAESGRVVLGTIYLWICKTFGTLTGFRILIVSDIALSALLFYTLLVRYTAIVPFYSLMAVLIGASYLPYQTHLSSTTFFYIFTLPFFITGIISLLECSRIIDRKKGLALRLLAHIMLLASYFSEAFVVVGFIVPFIVWASDLGEGKNRRGGLFHYYLRYADFPFVALAFTAMKFILMPITGIYAPMYALDLSLASLGYYYFIYFFAALNLDIFSFSLNKISILVNFYFWLVIMAVGAIFFRFRFKDQETRKYLAYIGVTLVVMGAIATPFVLAQRFAAVWGWEMRHLIPVGFLSGTIMVSTVCYFIKRDGLRRRVLLCLVILAFASLSKDYAMWQSRAAFDHGVMERMRENKELQKAPFIFVGINTFFYTIYRPEEWEMMMAQVYGNHLHLVTSVPDEGELAHEQWKEELPRHLSVSEKMPADPETVCIIRMRLIPSDDSLSLESGLHYLWLRLTGSNQELTDWLRQLVEIKTIPIRNCD